MPFCQALLFFQQPVHNKCSHIIGVSALAESSIEAQLQGQLVAYAASAHNQNEAFAQTSGFQKFNELGQVFDVNILLSYYL